MNENDTSGQSLTTSELDILHNFRSVRSYIWLYRLLADAACQSVCLSVCLAPMHDDVIASGLTSFPVLPIQESP